MISPFVDSQVRLRNDKEILSYGLSSFGYDIRLSSSFKIPVASPDLVLDVKRPDQIYYDSIEAQGIIIPAKSWVLGMSVETFCMPDNVMGICLGKSTYARLGVFPNVTPLEPGWKGRLTIELANLGTNPVMVYANEGICQIIFDSGELPHSTYADRKGKYQGQTEVTTARL
jgi:dCTP deaminase